MIRLPWTCPCGAKNTLILSREAMMAEPEYHDHDFMRCQTCRTMFEVKYRVEVFVTLEGMDKAE